MKHPDGILVCGDAMIDEYWYGEVTRISPEAPVPCVKILHTETRLGAADNVAANVRAMGGDAFTATCYTAKKIRIVGRSQQITQRVALAVLGETAKGQSPPPPALRESAREKGAEGGRAAQPPAP